MQERRADALPGTLCSAGAPRSRNVLSAQAAHLHRGSAPSNLVASDFSQAMNCAASQSAACAWVLTLVGLDMKDPTSCIVQDRCHQVRDFVATAHLEAPEPAPPAELPELMSYGFWV